jgi:transcriptional regulator with XRE-family HTH domain
LETRLGTHVFELAQENGWTDAELARRLGLSAPTIHRIKTGKRDVSHDFIAGAYRAFPALNLDDLFFIERVPELVEVTGG